MWRRAGGLDSPDPSSIAHRLTSCDELNHCISLVVGWETKLENLSELNLVNSLAFSMQSTGAWIGNCILSEDESPCWVCGDPTRYIEVNFEAPLCSEACCNELWAEYVRANHEMDRRYRLADVDEVGF